MPQCAHNPLWLLLQADPATRIVPSQPSPQLSLRTSRTSGAAQPRPLDALVRRLAPEAATQDRRWGKSSIATSGCKPVARAKVLPSVVKRSTTTPTTVPPSPRIGPP